MRDLTVLDIFEKTAERLPDKVYLRDEAEAVTYGQCRERAVRFGGALSRELNGERRRPIVLFMDKSCKCVSAMLGALYSGNFYVPMDVKTPLDRLNAIIDTMNGAVVVTSQKDEPALRKTGCSGNVLMFEELCESVTYEQAQTALANVRKSILDTELMYVLFTSGSTGTPKGVCVMHRSVVDYIDAFTNEVHIDETDIHGSQTPFYTDMSLKDVYMAMKVGAKICLIPQKYFMSPKKLLQYLDDNNVTTLMWVPTAYRLISQFDALDKVKPAKLKRFLFSGEGMPIQVFRYWREYYPNAEYIQQYGPTEITGACTSFNITRDYGDDETIPIGKAFPNTGILLLDEDDRVVTSAETAGEICVYGTCLASGYYNAPAKTAEVFVQNPTITAYSSLMYRTGDLGKYDENGDIVFISRKDFQIKHGGRRIELGEIETAFMSVEGVKAVCCVHNRAEDKLVLFYAGEVDEGEMPLVAMAKLPKYMIPAEYHKMDSLPVLPNGKTDRKKLDGMANEKG